MRVALCLSGMLGNKNKYGTGEATDSLATKGAKLFFRNIIDNNSNVDVFCHSWSPEFERQITSIYHPKKYLFEHQVNFGDDLDIRQFSIKSKWYSNKIVVQQVSEYEQQHGFEYDFVMLTRFDLALLRPINFSELDAEKFYYMGTDPIHKMHQNHSVTDESCCDINSDNYEINDLWFIASSSNMRTFSAVYDNLSVLGLDSNHRIARRHLQNTKLFDKRDTLLEQHVHNFCSKKDGDAPLVRWLLDNDL